MATEKWVTGSVQAAYASKFGTEINSLTNAYAVLSSVEIDNSTSPADMYGQVSVNLGSITTGGGALVLGIYIYPKNADDSTYGDGRFGTAAAGPPPAVYQAGFIPLINSVTQAQVGSTGIFPIPFGKFKLVAYNAAGVNLATGSNTIYFKSLNRAVN